MSPHNHTTQPTPPTKQQDSGSLTSSDPLLPMSCNDNILEQFNLEDAIKGLTNHPQLDRLDAHVLGLESPRMAIALESRDEHEGDYPLATYEQPSALASNDEPEQAITTTSPYQGGGMPPDSGPCAWEDLRLVIMSHSVHKVLHEGTREQEYVVSNLRTFNIDVALVDARDNTPVPNQLALRAALYYENGNIVRESQENEQLLQGDTEVMVIQGKGMFKLKMGPNALSNKRGKQRFRIRIEPKDERLRQWELLSVLTEPLRSVTKLERKPASQRAREEKADADALDEAISAPSNAGLVGPSSSSTPPPGPTATPLQGGSSAREAEVARLQAELVHEQQKTAAMNQLRQQLDTERHNNVSIQEALQRQADQIRQLTASNQEILAQLSEIRGSASSSGARLRTAE
mmetsp:Transcript_11543/g.26651  ORF Transcript_11543/g.26651 Transcript_11543/m.26651 type:complete len:403 (-) Transcript_11543:66-1274(-)